MTAKVYHDSDTDLKHLRDKSICILGYGSQGRAHALNLHDNGLELVVGLKSDSNSIDKVNEDGLKWLPIEDAVKSSNFIAFLLPDPAQPQVYDNYVKPFLKEEATLLFAHGFNIHYGQIKPTENVDVIMIAPKGPGKMVRNLYKDGYGVPSLLAIYQDKSGQAKEQALAYAFGIGGTKAGVIETTFKEETETDLFGEQAVLCGGLTALMKTGYEILVEAGYAPEMAYFECINEMKLIVDLIYQGGFKNMRHYISETAKYGDITRGKMIIDEKVRKVMQKVLEEIQDGKFAREWILENQTNRPVYNSLLAIEAEHPSEKVGSRLRAMTC